MDILGCTGSVGQRSAVLHKVILLAEALRSHTHDFYAFSAVMKALEMPQVYTHTIHTFYEHHTHTAYTCLCVCRC